MLLLELFTDAHTKLNDHDEHDKHSRYDPSSDLTIMKKGDTRKTRLTLEQINKIRRMQELRSLEKVNDEKAYQIQYAPPAAEAAPMM